MGLSDELVNQITKELVVGEVETSRKKIVPIIREQIRQYMQSTAFLTRIKDQIHQDLLNEIEDGDSLLEWLSETEKRSIFKKAIKAVMKID